MSSSTRQNVTRGAIFLYVENVAAMFMGYLFWFIITQLTTEGVIGTSGAIVSFAAILSTVINLGVPISVQRFLGRCFIKHEYAEAKVYVKASVILLIATICLTSAVIILLFPSLENFTHIEYNSLLVLITLGLAISSSFGTLLRGIIIASLKTRILFIATLLSTVSKFAVAFMLLFLGLGMIGLTIGILTFSILETFIMFLGVYDLLYRSHGQERGSSISSSVISLLSPIVVGGMPNWVPTMITSLGAQLGTVVVFGLEGSHEAGYYFIAFSIYSALTTVVTVVFSITFPVLSSMEKGRGEFSWRVVRLSLVLSLPLSFSFFFYPGEVLSLFGENYASGALVLDLLILSLVPIAVTGGFTNLHYSKGDYRRALIIGIASSLPRVALYFVLVPLLGGNGAALAFTIGSYLGLFIALHVSKQMELKVPWVRIVLLSFVPTGVSLAVSIFPISFVAAIPIIIALIYAIYFRLSLVTKEDITDGLSAFPGRISKPALKLIESISKHNGEEKGS
jgi:O-antigen/teichoic acid export membrane protein